VRFFVAMVSCETNTFSPIATDRRQFEAQDLRYGGEILEAYRGTGTCMGGMSSIHYRAAFEPIARAILEVDAPGLSSSHLGRFAFTRVRRPIFPLDEL
jgi:microcystin degradation protein MlrC